LLANSEARYIAIAYGMNDAQGSVATDYSFYNAYKALVDTVLAGGRIPVIPTISWTAQQPWQADVGDPVTGSTFTFNRQLAKLKDDYRAQGKVIIDGPDLWTFFKNNPTLIGTGDIHPTDAGYVAMQGQWAQAAIANVYQK
jgi:lysophospholipase L1-like esterase